MADNYEIVSQHPNTEISPTGMGFRNVWEVTYKVTSGPSKGTVAMAVVDEGDHNAEAVKRVIEDKISHLDNIASL